MATPDPMTDMEETRPYPAAPYHFIRHLSAELSSGEIRLPSFPDVAQRVQQVLDDERATPQHIAQVLSADAALAARILRIANSSVFNPTGKAVTDLPTAVGRLGYELVRCAAVSFALRQMKLVDADSELRPQLQELWRKGALVASIAYVLARETGAAPPDAALITGLLHNVGRLYLLVRGTDPPVDLDAPGVWDQVIHDWHPHIGKAILEHWKFPEAIATAVGAQNSWDRREAGGERLTDVLIVAISLVPCVFYRELLDDTVTSIASFGRLSLETEDCRRLLAQTASSVKALRDALAG